jgi:hypothetical protein
MSQILINDYLKQLDLIKRASGSQRETIVREAFKDLLKAWGRQHDLVFLAEYPLKTATKTNIATSMARCLHELRMPLGYWEAKDAADDLDEEITKKFKKGYPQDNIIFSDDHTAVLIQHKEEVLRCDMADTAGSWRSCSSCSSASSARRSPISAPPWSSSRPTCPPCCKPCAP